MTDKSKPDNVTLQKEIRKLKKEITEIKSFLGIEDADIPKTIPKLPHAPSPIKPINERKFKL